MAHEWFHALDHHMACDLYEAKLFESKFLSDKAEPVGSVYQRLIKENLRRQIEAYSKRPMRLWNQLKANLHQTPLFPRRKHRPCVGDRYSSRCI